VQVDGLRRELQFVTNSVSQLRYQQQEKRRQQQQEILLQADMSGGNNNNRSSGINSRCESLCKQACRLDLRNPNLIFFLNWISVLIHEAILNI
jgi:hypothetical protein